MEQRYDSLDDILQKIVHQTGREVDMESRPCGSYGEDRWIPIGISLRVRMPKATRKHVEAWVYYDPNPANVHYAKERLAAWKPEHKTLADVERSLSE